MTDDKPGCCQSEPQNRCCDTDADFDGCEKPVTAESKVQDELIKQVTEAQAKIAELTDAVLRTKADAENMRRRMQTDVENAHKYGLERSVRELLPIIDSLEHSLAMPIGDVGDLVKKMHEGVELTHQMFLTALSKMSVEQVNPLYEDFDSKLHEAVKTEAVEKAKPGSVVQVLQRGYTLSGRLVRPALVVVAA